MAKVRKLIIISICLFFSLMVVFAFYKFKSTTVMASIHEDIEATEENKNENKNITPYLFTTLSISLNGSNGKVWTTVKNDFTLFPSTVYVIVQLYSSYVYCENYQQMKLEAMSSTLDLDLGQTITAEASTGGEQKYWMGRMRYRIDNGDWQEKTMGVAKYSANGDFLGIS